MSSELHEQWTKVFEGSMINAKIIQNELEGEGIPAVVPDSSVAGVTEVNLIGIQSLDGCVFVPPDLAREALKVIELRQPPLEPDDPT